jgi:hypothetical protein
MSTHPLDLPKFEPDPVRWQRLRRERDEAQAEAERLREALEHIAQSVGARANGQDARLMSQYARKSLRSAREDKARGAM